MRKHLIGDKLEPRHMQQYLKHKQLLHGNTNPVWDLSAERAIINSKGGDFGMRGKRNRQLAREFWSKESQRNEKKNRSAA